jgi:Sulfatase
VLRRLFDIQPVALAVVVLAFIAPSIQVYYGNVDHEVSYTATYLRGGFYTIAGGVYVAICLGALLFFGAAARVYTALLVALVCCLFVQANFFVWNYGVVDGTLLRFAENSWRGYGELAFWVIIFASGLYCREALFRNRTLIALVLTSASLAVAGTTLWNRLRVVATPAYQSALTLYAYSKEKNVVIWISDGLQSDVAEAVLARRDDLKAALSGFTFYRDAVGHYRYTHFSVPTILSGRLFAGKQTVREFNEDIMGKHNISAVLAPAGFQTDMVSTEEYCAGFRKCNFYWADFNAPSANTRRAAELISVAWFRIAPHILKPYLFDGIDGVGTYILSHLSTWSPEELNASTQSQDIYYFRETIPLLNSSANKPTLKVLHGRSPHHPYLLNADCSYRGLRHERSAVLDQAECHIQVFAHYLAALRELGVYDNTLIFWVSDHGARQKYTTLGAGKMWSRISDASVTFAVKPAGATGEMSHSDIPVQLLDIAPTILDWSGVPVAGLPGKSLFAMEARPRIRYFFESTAMTRNRPITFRKFEIKGAKGEPGNWSPLNEFTSGGLED